MKRLKYKWIAGASIALGLSVLSGTLPVEQKLRWEETPSSLTLLNENKIVWRHVHDSKESKPYFHPLATIDGAVLTELRPDDHRWHCALWFSWKSINEVNYWEENPETGLSQGLTEISEVKIQKNEDYSAIITLRIIYREPQKETLLSEKRTLRMDTPDANGNYTIDWTSVFTAQADLELGRTPLLGEENGRSHGGYAGLSVRANLNSRHWTFEDSEDRVNESHGKAARWLEFHGKLGTGEEAGICLFDHPENPGYPNKWYATRDMPYFSPALLFEKGISLLKGETLRLSYRILIQSKRADLSRWAPTLRPTRATIQMYEDAGVKMYGPYAPVKLPLTQGVAVWNPTAIERGPNGKLYVANYTGEIYCLDDTDWDGLEDTATLYCNVTDDHLRYPTCMAWQGNDLYVGTTQEIRAYTDTDGDGVSDRSRVFFNDFPWTLHAFDWTFGLTFGPDEHAYVIFCTDYLNGNPAPDPKGYRGSLIRISPDGRTSERFATGLRYAYGLAFDRMGDLFFSDNKGGGNPTEEFNHATRGSFHGHDPNKKFADHPEPTPTLVNVKHGFGSGGLEFNPPTNDFAGTAGQMFMACWGPDGKFDRGSITRFALEKEAHGTYRAREYPVAKDCAKVIDLAFGPGGDLYAAQFGIEASAHRPYEKPVGAVYRFIPAPWVHPRQLPPTRWVTGDPSRGKQIYTERTCNTCHDPEPGREGVGPPLGNVGELFNRDEILTAIRQPGRGIKSGYETLQIIYKDGTELLGRLVRSSNDSIEVVIPGNVTVLVPRNTVASVISKTTSLMPEGLLDELSETDLNNLLAYLKVREAREFQEAPKNPN